MNPSFDIISEITMKECMLIIGKTSSVNKKIHKDPHNIDKMSISSGTFKSNMMIICKMRIN